MATPVHGSDAYTALEIAPVESEGGNPGYPSAYDRVPLVGENMTVERETIQAPDEIIPSGAVTALDAGPGRWRGSFTTLCYYNADWMHWLLCQLCGGLETLHLDLMANGVASPGVTKIVNTHAYSPQSFRCDDFGATTDGSIGAVPFGISLRLWKMGPNSTGAESNSIERINGARVLEAVFEQPEDDWLRVTWTVEGPSPSLLNGDGLTPLAQNANEYVVKPGDLARDNAHSILPSLADIGGLSEERIRGFTLRINNGLEFPSAQFLTDFDTQLRPGKVRDVKATFELRETLTKEAMAAGEDHNAIFLANPGLTAAVRLRYISAPEGATHGPNTPLADPAEDCPYALDFELPDARITVSEAPVDSTGLLTRRATYEGVGSLIAGTNRAISTARKGVFLIQATVGNTDEPSSDTKFNTQDGGGNEPHSSLL